MVPSLFTGTGTFDAGRSCACPSNQAGDCEGELSFSSSPTLFSRQGKKLKGRVFVVAVTAL